MKPCSKTRAKYIPLALTSILIAYVFYSFLISENDEINKEYISMNGDIMKINRENMNMNRVYKNFNEEHKNIVKNLVDINEEQKKINGEHFNINAQSRDMYMKYLGLLAQQRDILAHRPFPVYRRVSSKRPHWTSAEEFAKRKRQLDNVCSQRHVFGHVHGVYTHTSGVIYCYVPKAGCTFWKRIFTALSNFPPGQDPFNISRNAIHFSYGSGDTYSSAHQGTAYPVRLLVVRDPFSRLLSSYLDKIYLPDFWPHIAQRLILARETCSSSKDFLRSHFDLMNSLFDAKRRGISTCAERGCVKYLTFSEFVRGALVINEPHWAPIHEICNPCTFRATHVAYMESFNQDARPILHQMGMEHILDDFNLTKQINQEIEMLIDYHFSRIHNYDVSVFYQGCITPAELAYRLWQTFQWKGYIDPEMTYQLPNVAVPENTIKQELVRQVWQARKSGLIRPEVMKAAARRFREMAYRSVPKDLFENSLIKYYTDFELFGYKQVRNIMYSALYNGNYDSVFTPHEQ